MIKFYAEPWHEIDPSDNLIGTTVKWSEENEAASELLGHVLMLVVVAFLGTIFIGSIGPSPYGDLIGMAGIGLFLAGVGLFIFGRHLCTVHCELTFFETGAIAMPRSRLLEWLLGPYVLGDHRDIKSIQVQEAELPLRDPKKPPQRTRYEVWFYFTNGYSMRIAESLFRPQAHQVCVLMEQALAEIGATASQNAFNTGTAWAGVTVD